jgi:hypothetical protein
MGWMSWQTFRCAINCTLTGPSKCVSEQMYKSQANALVAGGFVAAGYNTIHLDDCIMDITGRDPATNNLRADPVRFPSGFRALGDYLHALSPPVSFGIYTAISTETCGGYPASAGYETLDAQFFADAAVDYVKADGCGPADYYPVGYPKFGAALQATGRDIVYSCSWPAYLGDDESTKPFAALASAGCNLWRNYLDMGPIMGYVTGIIEHFANYSTDLANWVSPGRYHDADMLLVGSDGISDGVARTQLAIYCIFALPLILGTDMTAMKPSHVALLLNKDMIAVNQDPMVRMGVRLGGAAASNAPTQVFYRPLANGDVAVALYNFGTAPAHPFHTNCATDFLNATTGGYFSSSSPQPQGWCTIPGAFSLDLLQWYCCQSPDCAGLYYDADTGAGCLLKDTDGPFVPSSASVTGYTVTNFTKPTGAPASITVDFASVGLFPGAPVQVYDIWGGAVVGVTNATGWTATVDYLDTAFFRLSTPQQQ